MMSNHGTRSQYAAGCRCHDCKRAKGNDSRQYRAAGGADSLVATSKARAHLRSLDVSAAAVARITGLSWKKVRGVMLNRLTNASTEAAILALTRKQIRQHLETTTSGYIPKGQVTLLLKDLKVSGFAVTRIYRPQGKVVQAGARQRFERTYRQAGVRP